MKNPHEMPHFAQNDRLLSQSDLLRTDNPSHPHPCEIVPARQCPCIPADVVLSDGVAARDELCLSSAEGVEYIDLDIGWRSNRKDKGMTSWSTAWRQWLKRFDCPLPVRCSLNALNALNAELECIEQQIKALSVEKWITREANEC